MSRRTRFYYRHKAAGLCVDCPALARPRRTRCALHGRIENLRAQLRYYKTLVQLLRGPYQQVGVNVEITNKNLRTVKRDEFLRMAGKAMGSAINVKQDS